MTKTMSITSKYQVTIPKEVRQFLQIKDTDAVTFLIKNDEVVIEKVPTIEEIQARARKLMQESGVTHVSDEDMKRAREIFYKKGLKW